MSVAREAVQAQLDGLLVDLLNARKVYSLSDSAYRARVETALLVAFMLGHKNPPSHVQKGRIKQHVDSISKLRSNPDIKPGPFMVVLQENLLGVFKMGD